MDLSALYPLARHTHIGLVTLSVALFAVRGLATLTGATWPRRATVRRTSILIDTLLLSSRAALGWLLSLNPLVHSWLGAKLALLGLYIALGIVALRPGRRWVTRALALAAALAVVAAMVGMARAHDLRGAMPPWL